MPACYVNDIQITNLGNTYQIRDGQRDIIFPEAYRFKLTFQSLLMDTRNIMNGMDKGRRVSVIENSTNLARLGELIANGAAQYGSQQYGELEQVAGQSEQQFGLPSGSIMKTIGGLPI
jgi:hypothetical protein